MTSNQSSQVDPHTPKSPPKNRRFLSKLQPGYFLVITIGGIALAEVLAMGIVYFVRHWPYFLIILADAAIMVVVIFPLIYFLLVKPLIVGIQQRTQSDSVLQARLRLMEVANSRTLDEMLESALNEIESLTESRIGFFHFFREDQKEVHLGAWSTNTLENICKAEGKGAHYDLEKAGVWADAARERKPVVHNNYSALQHRKGLPDGHAPITREMVIPILRDDQVVGLLGLGNKDQDYSAADVELASTFADFAWDIVQHMQAEVAISRNEEKFRTLVDWTYDWEMWRDPNKEIVYTSPSCERITGYTPQELIADPGIIFRMVHPDDRKMVEEHEDLIHGRAMDPVMMEYRIIARDGSERWIEHRCRPVVGAENRHLGRRISNRDITERKQIEKKISEQTQKELALTQTIHNLQTDIGRDLHDTLGNQISFLRMNLEHLSETQWSDTATIKNQIQKMVTAANESYEMVRAMLAVLQTDHLAEPLGLFSHYADQIADRSGLQSVVTSHGEPRQLSLHQIRQLYYIFREALGNIEKYARAERISTTFKWEDQLLKMVITDDGSGFDPAGVPSAGHYGLKFMRERAALMNGTFEIHSVPGEGTTLTVSIPYEGAAKTDLFQENMSFSKD